jgi:hypothetical protein
MKALPKILLALTAVAALSVAYPAKANLITNPGFETGDFTGWTAAGFNASVHGTFGGIAPHSGNFQAVFSELTNSITQNLATTPNTSYVLTFWLATDPNMTPPNSFTVQWGGSTIFSLTNAMSFGYTEYMFNVTASSATTALQFQETEFGPVGDFLLDDVSVNLAGAVPDGGSTVSLLSFACSAWLPCGAN